MEDVARFFGAGAVRILDGGLATTLEARGHRLDDTLWSAGLLRTDPGAVADVHRAFLEAGADCIATVTYQATFQGFARKGMGEEEAEDLFRLAVRLAVEARDAFWDAEGGRAAATGRVRPLVAASIGPYGAYLADGSEYHGRYGLGEEELVDFHRRRLRLLAASEAELLAFETVPSAVEARALARLLHETPGAQGWMSFTCADGQRLRDGTPVEEAVQAVDGADGLVALGVNCVAPAHVSELLARMGEATRLPLLAYPNSGEGWDARRRVWVGDGSGREILRLAPRWVEEGASGVGGCCRVGPEIIAVLRDLLLGNGAPGREARP